MKATLQLYNIVGGVGDQSNILGGDFNANVLLGYRVEKGEIIGGVKNTVISGNVYTVLRKIEALGNDSC